MNKLAIKNPKRLSDNDAKVNWYNYYAGFSNSFVKDVLLSSGLKKTGLILDPWNGAGTTTTAAAEAGYNVIGVDLNPVMCVIAKAKAASVFEIDSAFLKTKNLRLNKFKSELSEDDFLLNWFGLDTAGYIRYLSKTIIKGTFVDVSSLNNYKCVMLVALFNVVRDLVRDFIPSNPTWIKKANHENEKINATNVDIKRGMLEYIDTIRRSINVSTSRGNVQFLSASSKLLPVDSNTIDLIITSPPYCTRIDYGVATYPELAVLLGHTPSKINSLRRELIGRTTIDKGLSPCEILSQESIEFMKAVEEHVSHASSNYYLKNFKQYFIDMQASISEISRVVVDGGVFVCVVQDSYYKEIYCDLSKIISELSFNNGFTLIEKKDFKAKFVMANIHSGTRKYRSKVTATESVLVFKKIKDIL